MKIQISRELKLSWRPVARAVTYGSAVIVWSVVIGLLLHRTYLMSTIGHATATAHSIDAYNLDYRPLTPSQPGDSLR